MKRYFHIVLLLAASVSLSGCRDMFYREVDFTVEGEQKRMVLNSLCSVGAESSWFVLVIYRSMLATESRSEQGQAGVTDAHVSARINSGEWHTICNYENNPTYHLLDSVTSHNSGLPLEPLDTIEITVTHASYPTAHVRQVLPGTVSGRILYTDIMKEGWASVVLEIDPYQGNADDVIGIRLHGGSIMLANKNTSATPMDVQYLDLCYLYATNAVFSELENIRIGGYYGSTGTHCLFLPASALQEKVQITLFADGKWNDKGSKREEYFPVGISDLSLEVSAYTHDSYLYEQFTRQIQGVSIAPPYGTPVNNGDMMQQMLEGIAAMLGGQEMIPPFTNVEGGFGCVRFYTPTIVEQE